MNTQRLIFLITSIAFAGSLAGCISTGNENLLKSRTYIGTYTKMNNLDLVQIPISGSTTPDVQASKLILILSSNGNEPSRQFNFTFDTGYSSLHFSMNGTDFTLSANDTGCYQGETAQFCITEQTLSFSVTDINKYVEKWDLRVSDQNSVPTFESPQPYSVEELRQRALNRDYSTRIEFEQVVQAQLAARNAALNLIPHLSNGSILSLLSGGPMGLIGAIGDLAPFLLPNRWLQADETSYLQDAEQAALILMRSDAASIVEGMSLGLVRDQLTLSAMIVARSTTEKIREEVHIREILGQLPAGVTDDLDSLLNAIDKTIANLHGSVGDELRQTALASGFLNPEAIASVNGAAPDCGEIAQLADEDEKKFREIAISRSPELKQMDALIEAAKLKKTERLFNWMDPSGDYSNGLGLNLSTSLQIGESQVRELQISREQLQATVLKKVADALDEIEESRKMHSLASQGELIQKRRVDRLLQNLRFGTDFSPLDLVNGIVDQIHNRSDLIAANSGCLVGWTRLQRLTFQGWYTPLLDHPQGLGLR